MTDEADTNDTLAEADVEFTAALEKWLNCYREESNAFYMVLNDGQTFSGLAGCMIIRCPAEGREQEIMVVFGN
jgi:hypothetical protein